MTQNAKKYLFDIAQSIDIIFDIHLKEISSLEEYTNSISAQDGVEKRLIVIGEAAYRLRQMGVPLPLTDQLVNRRNTIIHQYDQFTHKAIWYTAQQELPLLKKHVSELLETEN